MVRPRAAAPDGGRGQAALLPNAFPRGYEMNKPLTPTPMLEPTTQAFIDSLAGGQPIQTLAPAEARAVLSGVQKAAEVPLLDVQIKDVTLPLGPTGSVNIRVVRPAGGTGVLPAIIYMH